MEKVVRGRCCSTSNYLVVLIPSDRSYCRKVGVHIRTPSPLICSLSADGRFDARCRLEEIESQKGWTVSRPYFFAWPVYLCYCPLASSFRTPGEQLRAASTRRAACSKPGDRAERRCSRCILLPPFRRPKQRRRAPEWGVCGARFHSRSWRRAEICAFVCIILCSIGTIRVRSRISTTFKANYKPPHKCPIL